MNEFDPFSGSDEFDALGSAPQSPSFERDVKNALKNATDALIALQSPDGWWKGELETNVTMDAEDLLLREFLGIRTEEQTVAAAKWIRSRQRDDGTWANFFGGPGELSTTIEAYAPGWRLTRRRAPHARAGLHPGRGRRRE